MHGDSARSALSPCIYFLIYFSLDDHHKTRIFNSQ